MNILNGDVTSEDEKKKNDSLYNRTKNDNQSNEIYIIDKEDIVNE